MAYKVQSGDTLSALAKKWGVSVSAIVKLNSIDNPNLIRVGQSINKPSKTKANKVETKDVWDVINSGGTMSGAASIPRVPTITAASPAGLGATTGSYGQSTQKTTTSVRDAYMAGQRQQTASYGQSTQKTTTSVRDAYMAGQRQQTASRNAPAGGSAFENQRSWGATAARYAGQAIQQGAGMSVAGGVFGNTWGYLNAADRVMALKNSIGNVFSGNTNPTPRRGSWTTAPTVGTPATGQTQQQRDVWSARYAAQAIQQGAGMDVVDSGGLKNRINTVLGGSGVWNQLPTSSRYQAFSNSLRGAAVDEDSTSITNVAARGLDELGNPILNENDLVYAARLTQESIMNGQFPNKITTRVANHLTWPRTENDYSFQYYGRTFSSAEEWLDYMNYIQDPSTGWYVYTEPTTVSGGYGSGYSSYTGSRGTAYGGSGGARTSAGYSSGGLVNWRI